MMITENMTNYGMVANCGNDKVEIWGNENELQHIVTINGKPSYLCASKYTACKLIFKIMDNKNRNVRGCKPI